MPDEIVHVLSKPIEGADGATITELRMHEPTGADLEAMDGSGVEAGRELGKNAMALRLVAACAGQPPSIVRKLRASDLLGAMEKLRPFVQPASGPSGA